MEGSRSKTLQHRAGEEGACVFEHIEHIEIGNRRELALLLSFCSSWWWCSGLPTPTPTPKSTHERSPYFEEISIKDQDGMSSALGNIPGRGWEGLGVFGASRRIASRLVWSCD